MDWISMMLAVCEIEATTVGGGGRVGWTPYQQLWSVMLNRCAPRIYQQRFQQCAKEIEPMRHWMGWGTNRHARGPPSDIVVWWLIPGVTIPSPYLALLRPEQQSWLLIEKTTQDSKNKLMQVDLLSPLPPRTWHGTELLAAASEFHQHCDLWAAQDRSSSSDHK